MRYHRLALGIEPDFYGVGAQSLAETWEWEQPTQQWWLIFCNFPGTLYYDQGIYPFEAEVLLVTRPGAVCRLEGAPQTPPREMTRFWFTFSCDPVGFEERAVPVVTQLGKYGPHLERDLRRYMDHLAESRTSIRATLWALLWKIAMPLSLMPRNIIVEKADELMAKRLRETFEIKTLAQELGVSHNHLINLFKKEFGVTPSEHMRAKRVRHAYRLLVSTTTPIKAIAAEVGIPDLQQFNKFVRAGIGRSPRLVRDERLPIQIHTRPDLLPSADDD